MSRLSVMPVSDAEWTRIVDMSKAYLLTRKPHVFLPILAATLIAYVAVLHAQEVPQILVSRQLATLEGLSVGDTVRLAKTQKEPSTRVPRRRIYEPTPDPARLGNVPREVRLHLPIFSISTSSPRAPSTWTASTALVDPDSAADVARELNTRTPGVVARPAEGAAGLGSTFVVLERFHFAIATVTIVAATVFLLALTIMLVDERRRDDRHSG